MKKIAFFFSIMVAFLGAITNASAQDLKITSADFGATLTSTASFIFLPNGQYTNSFGGELGLNGMIVSKKFVEIPYLRFFSTTSRGNFKVGSLTIFRIVANESSRNLGVYLDLNKSIGLPQTTFGTGLALGNKKFCFYGGYEGIFSGPNQVVNSFAIRLTAYPSISFYQK